MKLDKIKIYKKLKSNDFFNKILIILAILVVLSFIGGGEGSLLGYLSPILFRFVTFPLFFIGTLLVLCGLISPIFKKDTYKDLKISFVLVYLAWISWVLFIFYIMLKAIYFYFTS